MLPYPLEYLLCSGLFYALYKLLLEGRIAHRAARIYLVATALLAPLIPLLQLPLYPAEGSMAVTVMTVSETFGSDLAENLALLPEPFPWNKVLAVVVVALYVAILVANLLVVGYRLWGIGRLRRVSQLTVYEDYTLAESSRVEEPFSFWRTIFLNYRYNSFEREQVIAHEKSHIRHLHTAERLVVELLRCLGWFNPFAWAMAGALVEVHEWEADRDVLKQGYDIDEYRRLIFHQLFGYNPDITCGLNSQTSKKRFLMMTSFKGDRLSPVRYCAIIPLVVALILAFGSVRAEGGSLPTKEEAQSQVAPTKEPTSVVYIAADGTLSLNGVEMEFAELRDQLSEMRKESGAITTLTIRADAKAKVGAIHDVKEAARAAEIYRIVYDAPQEAVDGLSSPFAKTDTAISVSEIRLTERNLLPVFINANGSILTRQADGDLGVVNPSELKVILKAFIDNSEHTAAGRVTKNSHYSDFTWQTIPTDTEAGYERHCPVSNGVITIGVAKAAPAESYLEVQRVVQEAYSELREELSQRSFQLSQNELNAWQKEFIRRAIPIKVSETTPRE